jgi:hypothetical protein
MRPQPCVQNKKAHKRSHHGHTGISRHSPRNGFNGFLRALPGDRAFLPPSPAEFASANLTPASGRQDHTTSPSARCAIVFGTTRVHRIPFPTSVTIAKRPSRGERDARDIDVIWVGGEAKCFFQRDWTAEFTWPATSLICPSGKWGDAEWTRKVPVLASDNRPLNRHQNFVIRISAALAVDEAAHNSGGGDASGNAAFAPRLPLKLAPPNRP